MLLHKALRLTSSTTPTTEADQHGYTRCQNAWRINVSGVVKIDWRVLPKQTQQVWPCGWVDLDLQRWPELGSAKVDFGFATVITDHGDQKEKRKKKPFQVVIKRNQIVWRSWINAWSDDRRIEFGVLRKFCQSPEFSCEKKMRESQALLMRSQVSTKLALRTQALLLVCDVFYSFW